MRRASTLSLFALVLVGAVTVMALTACQPQKRLLGEGGITTAPGGDYTLCKYQPESEACRTNQ
jgi:hypothetical protein